jgi:hypothetical protein
VSRRAKKSTEQQALKLWPGRAQPRTKADLLADVRSLHDMWKKGQLGGEAMPEDAHPPLAKDSEELAAYFTLGMTLNYQRNSYALWRSCTSAFEDQRSVWVFRPEAVANAGLEELAEALGHHRIALQPRRHPEIWRRNAEGLCKHAGGRVRTLFEQCGYEVDAIRQFVVKHASDFPYLNGPKISNYWLFVMYQYVDWPLQRMETLSIAPDTHVIAASVRLGILDEGERGATKLSELTAERWRSLLEGSAYAPIDLHTPLWLWSRAGFPALA